MELTSKIRRNEIYCYCVVICNLLLYVGVNGGLAPPSLHRGHPSWLGCCMLYCPAHLKAISMNTRVRCKVRAHTHS